MKRVPSPPSVHGAVPRRLRVLVVDDNPGFRETLATLLATAELDVVGQATSGEEALGLLRDLEPDVVLMDVRMPGMDGIATTRRLKELRPRVGVVALTGLEDHQAVRDMLVAGASGYVLKDSDAEDILTAVVEAASGGAVISPSVTPTVIEELTEALERERRRTAELQEAYRALVERAAHRQELLARIGHELRTPVTVVLGMAQTLAEGTAPPEERDQLLHRLAARAADLARLVERLEMAVGAGLAEEVDVGELVRAVTEGKGRVRTLVAAGLEPVSLSPVVARRVLEELVDNALRFSGASEPVEVRVEPGQEGLEVRVSDRGPGIPPEDAERIFEPLVQVEALNVRTYRGAGLGLTLARHAARAMGGDVVLERTGPGGTTFLWRVARTA